MRYFLDTEFFAPGRRSPITLISLGLIDEQGRSFYAINTEFDWDQANLWLVENVKPTLHSVRRDEASILEASPDIIANFLWNYINQTDESPEFWTYFGAYDYVILSQLMGSMDDWPEGWPYYAHDLRQWLDENGHPDVSQEEGAHNALDDARWIRDTFTLFKQ